MMQIKEEKLEAVVLAALSADPSLFNRIENPSDMIVGAALSANPTLVKNMDNPPLAWIIQALPYDSRLVLRISHSDLYLEEIVQRVLNANPECKSWLEMMGIKVPDHLASTAVAAIKLPRINRPQIRVDKLDSMSPKEAVRLLQSRIVELKAIGNRSREIARFYALLRTYMAKMGETKND